jgi:hypothetical protein
MNEDTAGKATDLGSTSHSLVRTFARTMVGLAALGADEILTFMRTSARRGQEMEAGARKVVGCCQDNANVQAKAAEASRGDLMKQTWVTLDDNLKALSRMLTIPDDLQQAGEQPFDITKPAVQGEQDNGNRSTAPEKE